MSRKTHHSKSAHRCQTGQHQNTHKSAAFLYNHFAYVVVVVVRCHNVKMARKPVKLQKEKPAG